LSLPVGCDIDCWLAEFVYAGLGRSATDRPPENDVSPLDGRATLRLANLYIQQKSPREAEALLLKLVADLEKSPQKGLPMDVCLFTLARAYEADNQPLFAKQCLEHSVRFTRENEPKRYLDVLVKCAC